MDKCNFQSLTPRDSLAGGSGGPADLTGRQPRKSLAGRDPLAFWRHLPVRDLEPRHIESLRDRLADLFLSYGLAYAGDHEDPASAVSAAVAVITDEDGPDELAEDVAMSRLLCCAIRGDRACAWILAGVLDRRSRTDTRCLGLREGWRRLAKAPCRRECRIP